VDRADRLRPCRLVQLRPARQPRTYQRRARLPELQHIWVGHHVPLGPGEDAVMRVKAFQSSRWVVWWDKNHLTTWTWLLVPMFDRTTQLLTRVRAHPLLASRCKCCLVVLTEVATSRSCASGCSASSVEPKGRRRSWCCMQDDQPFQVATGPYAAGNGARSAKPGPVGAQDARSVYGMQDRDSVTIMRRKVHKCQGRRLLVGRSPRGPAA
jgi:hypothetical protein